MLKLWKNKLRVAFIVIFITIGIATLLNTYAATNTVNLEPENSVLSGNLENFNDTLASAGSAIRFGSNGVSLEEPSSYDSPLTITSGGTYTGNWQSMDVNNPAVTINTTQPVVINNSNISGAGAGIEWGVIGVDLTVNNSKFFGKNPNVSGQTMGRSISLYKPASFVFEHNYLENFAGVYILEYDGSTGGELTIRYNKAKNVNGLHSDGSGGWLNTYGLRQFVQLNKCYNLGGMELAWNEVINEPYVSQVEDNISIYQSTGSNASNNYLIHNNFIWGGYPPTDSAVYYGGGIMLGDGFDTKTPAYIEAYDNVVVGTTNYGIAIANGHDIKAHDNRIVGSGRTSDGASWSAANVGFYVWDTASGSDPNWGNNYQNNTFSRWWRPGPNVRNDWWLPDCQSGECTGNSNGQPSGEVTYADEQAEHTSWLSRVQSSGHTIGPQ